jgi:hypothetical protein
MKDSYKNCKYRALRAYRTPEEIRRATMHTTNKAFERYYSIEADDLRDIYSDTGKVIKIDTGFSRCKKC